MGKKIDLTGQKFGRLTVLKEAGRSKNRYVLWECLCDCGKILIVSGRHLRNGHTKSCGCLNLERITKHGMSETATYGSWKYMLQRCNNLQSSSYHNYGGRGIKVCNRWLKFENFFEDMGEKPSGLSIDRKDNNGDYEKENCRWSTSIEQNRNQRIQRRNTTGVAGVTWNERYKKYEVAIGANNVRYYVGRFVDLEQAIIARKQAEQKYWR